jgi:hypothetical protein
MTEEDNINQFLTSISYAKEDEKKIKKYLSLKGTTNFSLVLKTYQNLSGINKPTRNQVSDFYRYDKRLCYLLSRYFSTIEELLRAILVRDMEQIDNTLPLEKRVQILFINNPAFIKKINQEIKQKEDKDFFKFLKLSFFSLLLEAIINDSKISADDKKLIQGIQNNQKVLSSLRNAVFHSKFLFDETYDNNDLPKALETFTRSLPDEFQRGDSNHIGFAEELYNCGRGLQEGLMPIINKRL